MAGRSNIWVASPDFRMYDIESACSPSHLNLEEMRETSVIGAPLIPTALPLLLALFMFLSNTTGGLFLRASIRSLHCGKPYMCAKTVSGGEMGVLLEM